MLVENNLSETNIRRSVADVNYESFNNNTKCCNKSQLKPILCYCFGLLFYTGSCASSFYLGYLYEKNNYQSSGSS